MDPFSITVGAVALAETANKLASSLTERYRAFNNAPKEMLEIAGQVTMCAGLVDVFARSIDDTGEQFPKRFQQDASTLVLQCRAILKDIDEMIPHGSKKPDYADRLKYAFGSQKKIAKHQDNLKQVQHMFMFMTTCWQYQLPKQPKQPTSSAAPVPMGSLQGMMQHMPVQINMKTPGASSQMVTYEATLTLKPVEERPMMQETEYLRMEKIKKEEKQKEKKTIRKPNERQKQSLENMRRSPYFSMKLLAPLVSTTHKKEHHYVSRERIELRERRGDGESSTGKPPSKEEAAEEVEDLMSQWFDDDHELDLSDTDSLYENEEIAIGPRPDSPPRPKAGLYAEHPLRPSSAPVPEPRDWEWRCDGCDKKLHYYDTRYKCRDCPNFDFCPSCHGIVWHEHGMSSFVKRDI